MNEDLLNTLRKIKDPFISGKTMPPLKLAGKEFDKIAASAKNLGEIANSVAQDNYTRKPPIFYPSAAEHTSMNTAVMVGDIKRMDDKLTTITGVVIQIHDGQVEDRQSNKFNSESQKIINRNNLIIQIAILAVALASLILAIFK